MSAVGTAVDKLNNRYLVAIIVALFLYGLLRRFV
jgi:hypothetical protein